MKTFKFKFLAIGIALLGILSCSIEDDDSCTSSFYSFINNVTGPTTGTVNEPIVFTTKFKAITACLSSSELRQSTTFPKEITAQVNYAGCGCGGEDTDVTKTYSYTPTAAGEYVFKFLTTASTYITKTVVVTE